MVQPSPSLSAPLHRTLRSWWFLLSTAIACGLFVALTTWLAGDASAGVRVLAVAIGIVWGVAFMLLVAWSLTPAAERQEVAPPPPPAAPEAPVAPPADPLRAVLLTCLDEGRALQTELGPGVSDSRVAAWIDGVRQTLERDKPGAAGYFAALARRPYADDAGRLEAHLGRLATIVRDFV